MSVRTLLTAVLVGAIAGCGPWDALLVDGEVDPTYPHLRVANDSKMPVRVSVPADGWVTVFQRAPGGALRVFYPGEAPAGEAAELATRDLDEVKVNEVFVDHRASVTRLADAYLPRGLHSIPQPRNPAVLCEVGDTRGAGGVLYPFFLVVWSPEPLDLEGVEHVPEDLCSEWDRPLVADALVRSVVPDPEEFQWKGDLVLQGPVAGTFNPASLSPEYGLNFSRDINARRGPYVPFKGKGN